MADIESVVDAVYTTTINQLNAEFDVFQIRLRQHIQSLLEQGIAPEEVQKRLLAELENNEGVFGQFQSSVEGVGIKSINQTSNNVSNAAVSEESDKFRWEYEPVAEHCNTCEDRNGQIKTYDEWTELGLPGSGTTDCGIFCKCTLMPV